MALLLRQIWTLTSKNIRITLWRHYVSTPLRAFLLPVLIVLLLSFTQNFLSPDAHYGVGSLRPVRALSDLEGVISGGRDRVVFVNNGLTNGDIDAVINEHVAPRLHESGVFTEIIEHEEDLRTTCLSNTRGTSKCLAAAVFYSSPNGGQGQVWNYTIRADGALGQSVFVNNDNNDAQIYTIPLQHEIDFAIGRIDPAANAAVLNRTISEYPITSKTDEQRHRDNRKQFMDMITNILPSAIYLSIACLIYQVTGFIATEREIGMAKLLDTMMPNRARWQPQVARLTAHHLSFDMIYGPGWLATGAILGARCFSGPSVIATVIFHVLAGLSTTSFALFAGAFFRKAQLSGIISIIAALLLAIAAQLSTKSGTWLVAILALLFPPMNYVYFLNVMGNWESAGLSLDLVKSAPEGPFKVPAIVFYVIALYQTAVFHVFAALIERHLYGTISSSRKTVISESPVAVYLNGFTKEYASGWIARMLRFWNNRPMEPVLAVDNLMLQAWRGEILVLLGANGSGKTTTLDAISGQHSITSGEIAVNYARPDEGFGYCPQKNILWDDLTVAEHVQVFDGIKSVGKASSREDLKALVEACDLTKKTKGLSKSLSGGQKRKLQMAIMFAGGSTICCVDEVSSGVDPLSRRKLWDILLAERGRRSIILTTHFLDEADLLADRIAIMSKGVLKASGTSVALKHQLGAGYRVHLHRVPGSDWAPIYNDILHTEQSHETTYFPGTSTETYALLRRLDIDGVDNYEVKGPTLEDVFFKVEEGALSEGTQNVQRLSSESSSPLVKSSKRKDASLLGLGESKPVNVFAQIRVLIIKRLILLRRNPSPYIAALAIALIAAGCATIFIQDMTPGSCDPANMVSSSNGDQEQPNYRIVTGPESQLSVDAMETILNAPSGSVTMVDSLDQFQANVTEQSTTLIPGGFFLGDEPTMAWRADQGGPVSAHILQNLMNSLLLNITIEAGYEFLDLPFVADVGNLLLFTTLYGLAMAVCPAFLALYPTLERLHGVRAMHYSNGVRALPLWLAYLLFDFVLIVLISIVSVAIFGAMSDIWYSTEYLLLILLLYGIASTLYAYVASLLAKSQLAAFAITAGTQALFFLAYMVIFMVVFTFVEGSTQQSTMNIAFFTLALVSPVVSLARSLYLYVNIFGIACHDKRLAAYPGGIDLYGGPILYLVLQSLVLFFILLCTESGFTVQGWWKKSYTDVDDTNDIELQAPARLAGNSRSSDGLCVIGLRKQFKKNIAVDNVTFGIPRSECFALCGPNGAGKSTTISMIRGDLQPSGSDGEIFIDGISAMRNRGQVRTKLGVCPQIDPLDEMTVVEHLRFYSQIRGVANPNENVQAIMEAVGIEQYADRVGTHLSGGNKRKLSLGIALVGNPSVLLLDEPSSGMDAVSKRIMWRTLSAITPGRSLLLTTHSMEEADALAGRAGIIAGRMLALGSTEELRSRYANSYFVHLVHKHTPHTTSAEMEHMRRWVQREFPTSTMEGWMSYGQVKFEIPLQSIGKISLADIFGKLEAAKEWLGVQDYSVSTATLDQIFLRVVGKHYGEEAE